MDAPTIVRIVAGTLIVIIVAIIAFRRKQSA